MSNVACLNENYSMTRASENDKLEMPKSGEGGLRTQGCFKKSYDGQPLISIITVVYNGEKFLEETIESIWHVSRGILTMCLSGKTAADRQGDSSVTKIFI